MEHLADLIPWYAIFLLSLTLHEAAHSFVAMKLGDYTAYYGGQVTLNPLPHIQREIFGTVVVPILSFLFGGWMMGWASAPYDPDWAMRYPKRSALMAIAGPAANLFLVILAAIAIHAGIALGYFYQPDSIGFTSIVATDLGGIYSGVTKMVSIMFSLNVLLFVLNMLPFPPLDGIAALKLVIPEEMSRKYMHILMNPYLGMVGFFIIFRFFGYIYSPIHVIFINLLYWGSNYR